MSSFNGCLFIVEYRKTNVGRYNLKLKVETTVKEWLKPAFPNAGSLQQLEKQVLVRALTEQITGQSYSKTDFEFTPRTERAITIWLSLHSPVPRSHSANFNSQWTNSGQQANDISSFEITGNKFKLKFLPVCVCQCV